MDFKFFNENPKFKVYEEPESPDACLYYTGVFDQSLSSIFNTLNDGKFPENLRGNFAFVFKNGQRIVGAVDHLPTTNLFYLREGIKLYVGHIYNSLDHAVPSPNRDWVVDAQLRFFWGGSVGESTTNYYIKRLEAGTYFEHTLETGSFIVKPYIDLYSHPLDSTITKGDIADIIEQIVEEKTRDQFNLLWSSGTDSNCILGFIRKLNRTDRCNLISLYSNTSVTDERPDCEYLAGVYNLNPVYLNVGSYIGITDEAIARARKSIKSDYVENLARTWDGFWWEPNVFQKYTVLLDGNYNQYNTFTGEVGDQIFGSRFGKVIAAFVAQKPNATNEEIGRLFTKADSWRFRSVSVEDDAAWKRNLDTNPSRKKAWDNTINWCTDTWSKIDTGGDIINRSELLQYLYKGSHRVFNYSQLVNCPFVHPFADYRIFHTIFKTPGIWKVNNGKTRRLSLDIVRDHVDPGPWNWAKSGIMVPMAQKFKGINEKELKNVVRTRYQ